MADDNSQSQQLVKLALLGGAGFAAYSFLYKPWAVERRLQAEIEAQTRANVAKGMTLEDASTAAVSGACQAVAAFYKIPPSSSGGVCKGIGALATYTTKLTLKASLAAAKIAGKGVKAGVLGVGRGVKAGVVGVGKGTKAGVLGVGRGVKFVSYTAPKKVVTKTASAVKFVSYTAPKKVVTKTAKVAIKGVKSVAKSVAHGFGLWGLDPDATVGRRRPRRAGGAFPVGSTRRQALPNLATQRKRRSGTGVQAGRPRRGGGAAFYTRHLK